MPCPLSERLRPSRIGCIVQIPNPIWACSGIKVPWASYTVRPSTRQAAVDLLRSSMISHRAKPGEVVVEVLVRRLDYVVERLACPATAQAQLLVQREYAGGGAADGEHALAHVEVEDMEGGHPRSVVPRLPADVLDREVDGERRRPIRRQLEPARREGEILGAVGGLKPVVRQREARDRHSHLALTDGQLRVGVQRDVLAARRERQARRAPERSVEVRPPELVVRDEAVAGGGRGRRFGVSGVMLSLLSLVLGQARPRGGIGLARLRQRGRGVGGPESFSPARVAQLPAELALRLGV